ncbi:MAG: late competence development ComFB family protein [Lachnospiraceae bacterium]|nr:late competence development ComFB family protein [Lachnospiraceae bacterium]
MARKSNKTAHVLNLLAGQDTGEEPEKETEQEAGKETASKEPAPKAETPPAPSPSPAPQPEVPPHISIIDNGSPEEDPVAEQIRAELLKNLEPEEEEVPEPEIPAQPEPPIKPEAPAAPEPPIMPEAPAAPESSAQPEPPAITEAAAQPEPQAAPVNDAAPGPKLPEPKEAPAPQPQTPAEPEPDYAMVNVMERIVEDKIIYFMKQFEVCTCDRCKTDTIALTLNGLPAKYMVMDKAAIDPMVSFLTGRLISQITVEAVKACTQVKEHPRHEAT